MFVQYCWNSMSLTEGDDFLQCIVTNNKHHQDTKQASEHTKYEQNKTKNHTVLLADKVMLTLF